MRGRLFSHFPLFAGLFLVLLIAHLCHRGVLWADDTLPLAAAFHLKLGRVLYRDIWFDKPPFVAGIHLLCGAMPGVPLRILGALYGLLDCAIVYVFAREKWSDREAAAAACLLTFFLTFGIPSAVIPLAADSLLIAPHLAAIYLAWRGRPYWSGFCAGVGLLFNAKAGLVLLACFVWQWRAAPLLLAGFATPNAVMLAYMGLRGSASDYYREVWQWGAIYAAHPFLKNPAREGVLRTLNWLGFHAALIAGAIAAFAADRTRDMARFAVWAAIAAIGVLLGWRFFPRYYFILLPPAVMLAARGFVILYRTRRVVWIAAALLLAVPLIRWGPRYVLLARGSAWNDTRIDQDSRSVAEKLKLISKAGDSLFVWGFRAEIFVYAGMPSATRFLESQPLNGVFADRSLFDSTSVASEFTAANREEVKRSRPAFVVDGLGLLNPKLALARNADLGEWMRGYEEAGRTPLAIIYRRTRRAGEWGNVRAMGEASIM